MLKKQQIPNLLTFARVAAVPVCLVLILADPAWKSYALLWIFIAASLTDFLDGYLARKWNAVSPIGALLDPVADKLLVALMLVYLLISGTTLPYSEMSYTVAWDSVHGGGKYDVPYWFITQQPLVLPVAIILLRELYISGLREFLAARQIKLPVSKGGKWKTALQMLAIALLLSALACAKNNHPCGIIFERQFAIECSQQSPIVHFTRIGGMVTLTVSALLAFTSAIGYTRASWKHLR